MADEKGETRRQRNSRFGQGSPDIDVPNQADHVWDWFWELSARRKSGPEALSYAEIGEWQRLTRNTVRPEEVEMLMKMDDAYLVTFRDEQQANRERAADSKKGGRR